jgi:hypothetical protein
MIFLSGIVIIIYYYRSNRLYNQGEKRILFSIYSNIDRLINLLKYLNSVLKGL